MCTLSLCVYEYCILVDLNHFLVFAIPARLCSTFIVCLRNWIKYTRKESFEMYVFDSEKKITNFKGVYKKKQILNKA